MNNPYTREAILNIVRGILETVLGESSIDENAAVIDELGADSLDFVELNTAVEKRLNITLPKRSALEHAKRITGEAERFYDLRKGLTEAGVRMLDGSLYRYQGLKPGMYMPAIFNATTLGNVVNMCHGLFDFLPETCPDCGHAACELAVSGKVVCASCSAALRPMPGDDAHALHLSRLLSPQSVG